MSQLSEWIQDSWIGNLFGGLVTRPDGFTPLYGYTMIERKTPIVIDVSYGMLWQVYLQSPLLKIVIDRGADMFGNADVKLIDKDGNDIPNNTIIKLLKNPTPMHSLEEWLRVMWVMDAVYANTFVYGLSAFSNMLPRALWVLPSWDIKLIPTGKIFNQYLLEGIVKQYESICNPDEVYATNSIIHISTGVSKNPLIGQSKIPSLQLHISNSNAALTSRNINITEMGPKGILSSASSDSEGAIPLSPKERERIESEWTRAYGIKKGQRRINITTSAVKWNPIGFPTAEMMLFEETEEAFQAFCAEYGMARDIFPSTKGATFENAKQAERGTYQSTIQPRADSLASKLTDHFAAFIPPGSRIVFDYSWLPVMQEDEDKNATALNTKVQAVKALVDGNIINPSQGQAIIKSITTLQIDDSLASADPLISKLSELSPLVQNNMLGNLTINEVRTVLGLPPVPDGDKLAKLTSITSPTTAANG